MKTVDVTPANTVSQTRARIHFFMIVAGIVTTIICSLVLLQETHTSRQAEITPSKFAIPRPAIKLKDLSVFSAISNVVM